MCLFPTKAQQNLDSISSGLMAPSATSLQVFGEAEIRQLDVTSSVRRQNCNSISVRSLQEIE